MTDQQMIRAGISIIIPSYNYADYIDKSMGSVLKQLQAEDELLVVDDGSTDNTEAVIADIITKIDAKDKKASYLKKANGGAASARNLGVQNATCEYIILLDADDLLLPNALNIFRKAISENKESNLFIAGYDAKQASGEIKPKPATPLGRNSEKNFSLFLNKKIRISHGAFLTTKTLLLKTPYPENMQCMEDQSVYAHLLTLGEIVSIDASVVQINHHDNSLRNNIPALIDAGEKVAEAVFNKNVIPSSYMKYKKKYAVNRYLSVFRRLSDLGMYKDARHFYWMAFNLDKLSALKIKYLKRLLKALFTDRPKLKK